MKLSRLLIIVTVTLACLTGCGSSTPPIAIPAPTGGYINTTAPDSEGKVLVYGYIVANSQPQALIGVTVTNTTTSATSAATTDVNAYFEANIAASVGHSLNVTYTDSSGQTSQATAFTVSDENQRITMTPYDVALGVFDYAYVVANDGVDSEIVEVNLTSGKVIREFTFAGKLFDKIAIASFINYGAILDSTNKTLYWYDFGNLASEMAATSTKTFTTTPNDVALVELDTSPFVTDGMVVVSHDVNAGGGVLTTFPTDITVTPVTLGVETSTNCIGYPTDANYPNCPGTTYDAVGASRIGLIRTVNNSAHLAIVVYYSDGTDNQSAVHYVYFSQAGTGLSITFRLTAPPTYSSLSLDNNESPYAVSWYTDDVSLMTDTTNNTLIRLEETAGVLGSQTITLEGPRGVFASSDKGHAYVADQGTEHTIRVIDMSNFTLDSTSYAANYGPTELTQYYDVTTGAESLGVILTSPTSLFRTINISP